MEQHTESTHATVSGPVTDDLRRRGFGYDVIGIVLMHTRDDAIKQARNEVRKEKLLTFQGHKISVEQCQQLLDTIKELKDYDEVVCSQSCPVCKELSFGIYSEPAIRDCALCRQTCCTFCQPDIDESKTCKDCIRTWCQECGLDDCTTRTHQCGACKQYVCDTSEFDYCTQCRIASICTHATLPYAQHVEGDVMHAERVLEKVAKLRPHRRW
jgi:hypothetical protein